MTGSTFYKWLADPSVLDSESLGPLQEMAKRYPYFAVVQMLLAKNLRTENHIDQRRQLHRAAMHAPDRSLLLQLMEGDHPRPVRSAIVQEDAAHDPQDRSEDTTIAVAASEEKDFKESPPSVAPENDNEVETVPEPRILEIEKPAVERTSLYDLIPEPLIYRLEDAELPELPSFKEPEALSFNDWLGYVAGTAERVTTSHSDSQRAADTPSGSQLKDNMALIEDFLATMPKESGKGRTEFFKPSRAAETSNRKDFSVMTETLADIYFTQGNFELAAKAFDALAGIYPDKSSYFAARKKAALEKSNSH